MNENMNFSIYLNVQFCLNQHKKMLSEVPKNNEILRKNARKSKMKKNNNI